MLWTKTLCSTKLKVNLETSTLSTVHQEVLSVQSWASATLEEFFLLCKVKSETCWFLMILDLLMKLIYLLKHWMILLLEVLFTQIWDRIRLSWSMWSHKDLFMSDRLLSWVKKETLLWGIVLILLSLNLLEKKKIILSLMRLGLNVNLKLLPKLIKRYRIS